MTDRTSRFSLDGRVAVVTGGGTGIGQSIAKVFAEYGADIVLTGRRREPLEKTASEIEGLGRRALVVQGDVTDIGQCQNVVDTTMSTFDRLDILVNNAGGSITKPVADWTPEEWAETIGVNLSAVWFMSRCASKPMLESGKGAIVNISSTASLLAFPIGAPYGAAKAGVNNLTASLASEWTPHGIRVNAIACGAIRTEKMLNHGKQYNTDEDAMAARILMGRIGDPEEVGYAALYFASDASSYTSGQTLTVNGGPRPAT